MRDTFDPCVCLMAWHRNGTLYVGVTSDLVQRVHRHREGLIGGFTSDYGVHRLVWFDAACDDGTRDRAREAIEEMEPGVESRTHRNGQPGLARLAVDTGLAVLPPRPVTRG